MGKDAVQTGWVNVGKKTKRKAHNIVNEATFKDLTRKNRCHEDVGRIGLISGRQPQAKARASPRISTRSPALANDCNILSRPKSTACNSRRERVKRGECKRDKERDLERAKIYIAAGKYSTHIFTSLLFASFGSVDQKCPRPTDHVQDNNVSRFPLPRL